MNAVSESAKQLGRIGGLKLREKRGRKYFSELGKKSGAIRKEIARRRKLQEQYDLDPLSKIFE